MLTEIQHAKQLNSAGFSLIFKKFAPITAISMLVFAYSHHCDLHKKARSRMFYNRSKLFGGAQNPQY